MMTTPKTPQHCGLLNSTTGELFCCTLAAGHRSAFHMDVENLVTWSNATDLETHATTAQADARCRPSHFAVEEVASGRGRMSERFAQRPVSLQHDACGARLTVQYPRGDMPRVTHTCALGPHDLQTMHRAAGGTQWRASDFPPTAPPTGDAVARSVVAGLGEQFDRMAELFGSLRDELDGGARRTLDAVRAALKTVGLGFDTPVNDIGDLAGQRDSHAEHAKNCEDALERIADLARQAHERADLRTRDVLLRIIAVTEEKDR